MAKYTVTNELKSLEFETSCLENIAMTGTELTLTFREAIVVGNSQSGFHQCKPCSCNNGPDCYALPKLTVTFRNYNILSILIEEKNIRNSDNSDASVIPARVFSPEERHAFMAQLMTHPSSWVYYLGYYQDTPMIYMAFTPEFSAETHEIWFTAEENIAQWEAFGDIAFYLQRS